MKRKRTTKEVRRYDIFKLSIILILIVLIFFVLLRENDTATVATTEDEIGMSEVDESTASYPPPEDAVSQEAYPADDGSSSTGSGTTVEAYPAGEDTSISEAGSAEQAYPADSDMVAQDTILPTVLLPDDDVFTGGITLFGTGQPDTQVQLYADETMLGTVQVDANGNYTIEVDLDAGHYNIDVAALDSTGNPLERYPALSLPVLAQSEENIVSTITEEDEYSTLVAALEITGIMERLSNDNATYTLIAPTDTAFSALPIEVVLAWEANPDAYSKFLLHNLLVGAHTQDKLVETQLMPTVAGTNVEIAANDNEVSINGVPIMTTVSVGNGIIHTVDQIIFPPVTQQVQLPIIDMSNISIDGNDYLTVVGTAEPGTRILLQVDNNNFGELAAVDDDGSWLVAGDLTSAISQIVAYMIDDTGLLTAISSPASPPPE